MSRDCRACRETPRGPFLRWLVDWILGVTPQQQCSRRRRRTPGLLP